MDAIEASKKGSTGAVAPPLPKAEEAHAAAYQLRSGDGWIATATTDESLVDDTNTLELDGEVILPESIGAARTRFLPEPNGAVCTRLRPGAMWVGGGSLAGESPWRSAEPVDVEEDGSDVENLGSGVSVVLQGELADDDTDHGGGVNRRVSFASSTGRSSFVGVPILEGIVDGVAVPDRSGGGESRERAVGANEASAGGNDTKAEAGVGKEPPDRKRRGLVLAAILAAAITASIAAGILVPRRAVSSKGHGGAKHDPPPAGSNSSSYEQPSGPPPQQQEAWPSLGSPIHGLRNESGLVLSLEPDGEGSVVASKSYGPVSNFTASGRALSLSFDGKVLAVGEPGTETVRVFEWDEGLADWRRRGQVLRHKASCENEGEPDPTQFLPCFHAFGFNIQMSSDASILAVQSIAQGSQAGMVRAYRWNEKSSLWERLGQDLHGDAPNDSFGSNADLSLDGRTLAVTASQSLNPWYEHEYDIAPFRGPGYLRIFDFVEDDTDHVHGGRWLQRGSDIVGRGPNDSLSQVSLSGDGNTVVAGTRFGGYVVVYDWRRDDSRSSADGDERKSWLPRGDGPIFAPIGEDEFGWPVIIISRPQDRGDNDSGERNDSISKKECADRLLIGSKYSGNGASGTADANLLYLLEWASDDDSKHVCGIDSNGTWTRLERQVNLESNSGDRWINGVKASYDGSILVAAFEKGVQVFEWENDVDKHGTDKNDVGGDKSTSWRYVQKGELKESGMSLAVSGDGSTFAAGNPLDNRFGFGMGRTTVHKINR